MVDNKSIILKFLLKSLGETLAHKELKTYAISTLKSLIDGGLIKRKDAVNIAFSKGIDKNYTSEVIESAVGSVSFVGLLNDGNLIQFAKVEDHLINDAMRKELLVRFDLLKRAYDDKSNDLLPFEKNIYAESSSYGFNKFVQGGSINDIKDFSLIPSENFNDNILTLIGSLDKMISIGDVDAFSAALSKHNGVSEGNRTIEVSFNNFQNGLNALIESGDILNFKKLMGNLSDTGYDTDPLFLVDSYDNRNYPEYSQDNNTPSFSAHRRMSISALKSGEPEMIIAIDRMGVVLNSDAATISESEPMSATCFNNLKEIRDSEKNSLSESIDL